MSKKKYARRVAMALCKANTLAGIPWEGEHFEEETSKCLLTLTQRAENLLKEAGSYGAYVVEGDPSQWSGGSLCTIYMEPKGGPGDVQMVEVEEVHGDRALVGWRCPYTGDTHWLWADVQDLRDTERRN